MNRLLHLTVLLLTCIVVPAASHLAVSSESGSFVLASGQQVAAIVVADKEPLVVQKSAALLADDVQRVTGLKPVLRHAEGSRQKDAVIIATLGHNAYVDQLVKKGKLDVSAIRGAWERFVIRVVDGQLLIVGSDRRGAAYGVFTLSEEMGVSPWYWWADVPVRRQSSLFVDADYVSKAPTVKYRGIFINDEDWGLKPWAATNFERELGDIGPRTYSRVCELLLRLKANMLAPAMHSCTGAFYSHPESKVVCDSFGIIITTSHCEPLLFNNAALSEWDKQRDGEWNYETNSKTILQKLDNRVKEAAGYENIYTMGLRGLHDEAMKGSTNPKHRARTLEKVFDQQRAILLKHTGKKGGELPQIFVPYKETLDIYDAGLRVPDDITLVWPDDNYGYMKRVSNSSEQRRSGGSGVYYHLSYLGTPHDNLWLATTPPMLMYEELLKAYTAGADRYWLLNVGDIKPMEMEMQHFFDMAYDFPSFSYDNVNAYQARWLASLFGVPSLTTQFQFILDHYYRLAWDRKPEFMGYEYEWDSEEYNRLHDTDFSFETGTAQKRLLDYEHICRVYDGVERSLRPEQHPALFELLGYAVRSACQMNRKFLYAQANHETGSSIYAAMSQDANEQIEQLRQQYNSLFDGKWNQMISTIPPGYTAKYQLMPALVDKLTDAYRLPDSQLHPQLRCKVDLAKVALKSPFRLLEGIGTDWQVLQLGQPLDFSTKGSIDIALPSACADSVSLCISVVPLWPVARDRSNRFAVSVDRGPAVVCENQFQEWGPKWKLQVLENRKEFVLTLPLDASRREHFMTLTIVDPGQMIQKITYQ